VKRLVLFDVDGTLLDCSGQSRQPFSLALQAVFGVSGDGEGYDFSGKTDGKIAFELACRSGVPESVARRGISAVRERYLEELPRWLRPERTKVLPGVERLLAVLRATEGVAYGLLTGNWRQGAIAKLTSAGLPTEFAVGAFGEDGFDREELPPVALQRAEARWKRRWMPSEVWIVGDSLLDVQCARAWGLQCLAVATGKTPFELLQAAGASWVVGDLQDPTVFELLVG
jgi:phosphoglycolate phosphatase-like HAD superfamily hydrolase